MRTSSCSATWPTLAQGRSVKWADNSSTLSAGTVNTKRDKDSENNRAKCSNHRPAAPSPSSSPFRNHRQRPFRPTQSPSHRPSSHAQHSPHRPRLPAKCRIKPCSTILCLILAQCRRRSERQPRPTNPRIPGPAQFTLGLANNDNRVTRFFHVHGD